MYSYQVNWSLNDELDNSISPRKLRNCQDWSSRLVANAKSIVPLSSCTQTHGWASRPAYPARSIFKFRPFLANSQLHRTATSPRGKCTSRSRPSMFLLTTSRPFYTTERAKPVTCKCYRTTFQIQLLCYCSLLSAQWRCRVAALQTRSSWPDIHYNFICILTELLRR